MSESSSTVTSEYPQSVQDLACMEWDQFEIFAVDVVRSLYHEHGLSFSHTKFSHDYGRDGDGEYVLGMGLNREAQIVLRVWVEVKRRGKRNVGKGDISSHLVDASLNGVHCLIFVTNRDFSSTLGDWISEFGARARLQFQLINGAQLLQYARSYLYPLCKKEREAEQTSASQPQEGKHPKCIIRGWFTRSPCDNRQQALRGRRVLLRDDRPVFANLDVTISGAEDPFTLSFTLRDRAHAKAASCFRYRGNIGSPRLCSEGTRFRETFVIWPNGQGVWQGSDFVVETETPKEIDLDISFEGSFRTPCYRLRDTAVQCQEEAIDCFKQSMDKWSANGGFESFFLVAPPGVGKSRALGRIRHRLHGDGVMEVFIDCERVRQDSDLLCQVFSEAFPVPPSMIECDFANNLEKWCREIGLSDDCTSLIVDKLCCDESIDSCELGFSERGELLRGFLTQAAFAGPVAWIVEDIHKAPPSVLALIADVCQGLRNRGDADVLLIAVSRPFVDKPRALTDEWMAQFAELLGNEQGLVCRMGAPSKKEAVAILQNSIPSLEEHHCITMVNTVGTVPYSLREAVLYLLAEKVLQQDQEGGTIIALSPEKIGAAAESRMLAQATRRRVHLLCDQHGHWLWQFLVAGATYGRQFPLDAAAQSSGYPSSANLADSLDLCAEWSIAAVAPYVSGWIEFDHDLMRQEILTSANHGIRAQMAQAIYHSVKGETTDQVLCRLAYQAGQPEICLQHAQKAAKQARGEARLADVVEANELMIRLWDPVPRNIAVYTGLPLGRGNSIIDISVLTSPPCGMKEEERGTKDKTLFSLLVDSLECLMSIGSGSSRLTESLISESRMLAEHLQYQEGKAKLTYIEGRMWFERDRLQKALELHRESEAIFSQIEQVDTSPRAANLVRYAICLRQKGDVHGSLAVLRQVLSYRNKSDWLLLCKVRSNAGAAFLYYDWGKVRYHWTKHLELAQRRGLNSRRAHALASLSFLDLFEGDLQRGEARALAGLEEARKAHSDNQKVRLLLDLGIHAILCDVPHRALSFLLDAERTALQHTIGRRLWRVVANLATVYELLDDHGKAFARDAQVVRLLIGSEHISVHAEDIPDPIPPRSRSILPLVNIILRSRGRAQYDPLVDTISSVVGEVPMEYAEYVSSGEQNSLPFLLDKYCVDLACGPRFLLSE